MGADDTVNVLEQIVERRGRAPALLEPFNRFAAAVGGAVVDDPEDAARGGVGLLGHHLPDEPVERLDPAPRRNR